MARKSRKNIVNTGKNEEEKQTGGAYRVAIYVRLSVEDERKIECESVENQIKLLRDYVESSEDLVEYDLYVDRGFTGTKFDRPEFNRMVADMRAGKFNCIVVKDLSRLGRNYLETGNYLESIFPIFGIRFISVTDHYDSLTAKASEDGLIVPLKNLINEAYAKDISKKVSSSVIARQKQGKHTASRPPYGYKNDPADSGHLIVDEEVRSVVIRIFEERFAGKSFDKIAAGLNDDGIAAPGARHYELGNYKNEKYKDCLWGGATVRKILMSRCYIGDMVQGRTRTALYKGQAMKKVDPEDYIVVEGTHEPIVSRELFDKVQKIFEETGMAAREKKAQRVLFSMPENFYDGLFYCGECGKKMKFTTSTNKGVRYFYYACPGSGSAGRLCSSKSITKKRMDGIIEKILKDRLDLYGEWRDAARKINATSDGRIRRAMLSSGIQETEREISGISVKSNRLYEDFADGLISEEDYLFAKGEYQKEIKNLEKTVEDLKHELEHFDEGYSGDAQMAKVFESCDGIGELTKDMAHNMIRKILYYGKDRMEITFEYEDELHEFIDEMKGRYGYGEE